MAGASGVVDLKSRRRRKLQFSDRISTDSCNLRTYDRGDYGCSIFFRFCP